MTLTRQQLLIDAFATLADTLVAGYDVVELLQTLVETCQQALDVTAAGLLLADASGRLELVASTSEESRVVEVLQLSADAGPCIDAFHTSSVVTLPDVQQAPQRWRAFRDSAREQGFASVYAIPLRLRETTIGALNLFRGTTEELDADDIRAAQALADVATIGILQERAVRQSDDVREQLQLALNSRVIVEQAKGVLAYTHNLTMDEAFARLRQYSRSNRLPLSEVAKALVQRTLIF
jgi:transcriptional regulator with GAF, ATPase, and Fis domain